MDTKTFMNQNNMNMKKIPCIPIMSNNTINIHLPIGAMVTQQPNHLSRNSEGSSRSSSSPPLSPTQSASSTRSSPPLTPQVRMLNGLKLTDDTFETDSAVGSSQEDRWSVKSLQSSAGDMGFNSETSSVGVGVESEDRNGGEGPCAAAIYMDREVALMVKVLCQSEEVITDSLFVRTMIAVMKACGQHYRRNDDPTEFSSVAVNKIKLSDQRPAKEHIAEVSRELGKSVTISETIFRRLTDAKEYVGTFVHDVVKAESNCTIAKVGAMVTLKKVNKIAPAREFSDQLCEHIMTTKPAKLGERNYALDQQKLKTQQKASHSFHVHRNELLCQTFIFDPTINVAEAARRSFVEVQDFVLYE